MPWLTRQRPGAPQRIFRRPWWRQAGPLLIWLVQYPALLIALASTYHLDPIETRLAFPMYFSLVPVCLGAGFANVDLARPDRASFELRRVLLSLLFAVVLAGLFFPARPDPAPAASRPLEEWIRQKTSSRALVIGAGIWDVRFRTGRTVLESGYPSMPDLTPRSVAGFLRRYPGRFDGVYLIVRGHQVRPLAREYAAAGFSFIEAFAGAGATIFRVVPD